MAAPATVLDLVERFDRNVDAYRSGAYNETQVRREFIDPLFKALGWDIDNEAGNAPAYKDVVHEDAIKVGGLTKAPDYCFRIGGTRKFFVEAKRPAVNLKDDIPAAFQLRRYAWSAKLPLSILTDFDEIAIYDCRVRPTKTDGAAIARTMYLTYKQYSERWDDIASVFSKTAVLQGSFDRYADTTKGKKGTAEVDAAFLGEIEEWRSVLARTIALRNPGLTQRELNYAVQATIDRIIFLRICEDGGIEEHGGLLGFCNGVNTYRRLVEVFEKADQRYNSGLFHFRQERGRTEAADALTPGLVIDDKTLKGILKRLYYPDSPYEFSVLPADILGQVYEQFLGKVIRLTAGHRAVVEDKPEVKKAGGVYYTPTYIVDYIVKNTVGKLLHGSNPKKAAELRILDPACGSGSFLIGAFQYLMDWHRDWYVADGPEKHKKEVFLGPGGEWRLTTAEKKRMLINNLYGVDIDAQAVETTKLSLLLKVLEGDTAETINAQLSFLRERALPDLSNNIKCGNSLIGPDFYENQQLGMTLFDEEERYRINAFDWQAEFPAVLGRAVPEGRRGFDAVIGNPPYIRIQRIPHGEADYYYLKYQTPASKTDLSQLFLEKSLTLVNKTGLVGFICTSQWLQTDYGQKMRALVSEGILHEIVHFGSLKVFQKANTYPAIFILGHEPSDSVVVRRFSMALPKSAEAIASGTAESIANGRLSDRPWNLGDLDIPTLMKERGRDWRPLADQARVLIGDLTGMDAVFVLDPRASIELGLEEGLLLPYAYRGVEVRPFEVCEPSALVIYPYVSDTTNALRLIEEQSLAENYPRTHAYLAEHKADLRRRMDSRRLYADGPDWYRHLRPGSWEYILPRKLIVKGIATRSAVGMLAERTVFNGANCPAIIPSDSSDGVRDYLLGLLNSKVVSFYLRGVCPPKLGGYSRFNAKSIASVPVPVIQDGDKVDVRNVEQVAASAAELAAVRARMVSTKTVAEKTNLERAAAQLEQRLNEAAYQLYSLIDTEISIIESAMA